MIKHKLFLLSLFLFYGATAYSYTEIKEYDTEKVISRDSTFYYASLVNDYFMRNYPDPTANSFVGGKKRNSRIWTRGVYYEGLMSMYRQTPVEKWYDTNGYQMTPKLRPMPISIAAEWHISTCICSTPCKQSVKHILKIISMP